MAGPNKPKWSVNERSDWDILYQQSVLYYWNIIDAETVKRQKIADIRSKILKLNAVQIEYFDDVCKDLNTVTAFITELKDAIDDVDNLSNNIDTSVVHKHINHDQISVNDISDIVKGTRGIMLKDGQKNNIKNYCEKLKVLIKQGATPHINLDVLNSLFARKQNLEQMLEFITLAEQIQDLINSLNQAPKNNPLVIKIIIALTAILITIMEQVKSPHDLYFIYSYMGVDNIDPAEQDGVIFKARAIEGDSLKPQEYQILRVLPNYGSDDGQGVFEDSSSFTHVQKINSFNGWEDLTAELTINIPNRALLHHNVITFMQSLGISAESFDRLQSEGDLVKKYLINYLNKASNLAGKDMVQKSLSELELVEDTLVNPPEAVAKAIEDIFSHLDTLLYLELCSRTLLGNGLSHYYAYLLERESKADDWDKSQYLFGSFVELFGVAVVDLIYIAKGLGSSYGETEIKLDTQETMLDVSIPDYLVTLGILEKLNENNYNKIKAQVEADERNKAQQNPVAKIEIDEHFYQRISRDNCNQYHQFARMLADIEKQIYVPLTSLLSSYVSLGLYFPFSLDMTQKTITQSQKSLIALKEVVESAYSLAFDDTEYDIVAMLKKIYHNQYGEMSHPTRSIAQNGSGRFPFSDDISVYQHYRDVQRANIDPTSSEQNTSGSINESLASGDRGGAASITDDIAWDYFMPRVIAYNWAALNSTEAKAKVEVINDQTHLKDCKAMLYSLGYSVPETVNIRFKLVEALPFKISPNCQSNDNISEGENRVNQYQFSWNYYDYISTLTVDYPDPPDPKVRTFAMCDLNARRPNQPFTTA